MQTVSPGETTPTAPKKSKSGAMSEEDFQSTVKSILVGCEDYVDHTLADERTKASDYYDGKPLGNEKPGRSQFVHTEVRDQVNGMIPSLMKLVFGPEQQVEFAPETRDQVAMAEEMTRKVQHVFTEENNGFLETLALLQDGLIRQLGVFKFWWEAPEVTAATRTVSEDEAVEIAAEDDVEVTSYADADAGDEKKLAYTKKSKTGRVVLMAIPTEEIIYNADARDGVRHFVAFGHRTEHTKSELLAMYPDKKDEIEEYGRPDTNLDQNSERAQRRKSDATDPDRMGESNEKVKHVDVLMRLDKNGDGKNELLRVCAIGAGFHVLSCEPATGADIGYATFCPSPKAHTLSGDSWAKRVMDLQYTGSMLIRGMLDSLGLAIFPRVEYVEGAVNVGDVMNTAIGAPIRTRAPGMVKEFTHSFVGKEAMPVLEFMQGIAERRTGMSRGTQDLDLDALQSTTKSGVDAAVAGSQSHIEMVARILGEMTLKPLFRGIADMLMAHQTEPSEIEIDGQWVPIDPSQWKPLRPRVKTQLGSMMVERKLQSIGEITAKQENALQTMGPENPLCGMPEYRNALALATKLSGFPNPERFWKPIPADWKPPQAPEKPSPEELVAQIEQQKLEVQKEKNANDLQMKQMELSLKEREMSAKEAHDLQKLEQEFEIARMKIEMEMQLAVKKMELEYQTKITEATISSDIDAAKERAKLDAEQAKERAKLEAESFKSEREAELERERMEREHALEREKMEREQEIERERLAREDAREAAKAERETKAGEAERETRKAEAAKPPVVVNVHAPKAGKKKINRDKDGRAESVEEVD